MYFLLVCSKCMLLTIVVVLLASVLDSNGLRHPPGHLQPLGSHQPPTGQVESVDAIHSPEDFYRRYVAPGRPVILSGAARLFPAYRRWNDWYLMARYGNREMQVDAKKEVQDSHNEDMKLLDFLQRYKHSDLYMVDRIPKAMMKELYLPQSLACGGFAQRFQDINLWLSNGGTTSTLHMDNMDNLNCMVSGTKDWFLLEKHVNEKLNLHHDDGEEIAVDVERVDMYRYPALSIIPWWSAKVPPGDCLYVPQGWFHHVRSHGRNMAVNIWWTPMSVFNHSDCSSRDYCANVQLSSLKFRPGIQIRFVLKTLLEEYGGELQKEMVQSLVLHHGERIITDTVFTEFDLNSDGCLSVAEIEAIKETTIEVLLPDVQLHGVNTYGRCQAYNNTCSA
ncbi:bifunctional peptidase and arginyl-hydroxylase JMJD5-like [Branchiostoma floridae]|uniref:Bifunctional peptidase and arginyl-hydroxylase JMJD5-like n=1 Tax=Branchiostoma floridae TaxID=7739 RepID=A0A9J7KGW2_BRAFL|nr:bifunctional peptidase and arginyl-hydroxylase JMJD5-like [Branchiostoma floridae]